MQTSLGVKIFFEGVTFIVLILVTSILVLLSPLVIAAILFENIIELSES